MSLVGLVMKNLKIKLLSDYVKLPTRGSSGAAGWDVYCPAHISIAPQQTYLIKLGFKLEIPKGYYISLLLRSSWGKKGLTMPHGVGIIDEDYRGEMGLLIKNDTNKLISIKQDERVAQIILQEYEVFDWEIVDELQETARNTGGFGSTGK